MTQPAAAPASLSVVTPSYQYARFLPTCLRSVHDQSSPWPVQHVVVDDGSTDSSWDVIQRLHARPEDTARNAQNQGLSRTLTSALRRATGDVVSWLNADDFHLPWAYREVARAFDRHPDATIVYGDTVFVDDDSRLLRLVPQPAFDRRVMEGGFNMFHVPSVFFRRDAVPSGWTFDDAMHLFMDLDLWLALTGEGAVVVKTDTVLSAFRRHPGQVSASVRDTDAGELRSLGQRHRIAGLASRGDGRWSQAAHARHAVAKVRDGSAWRQLRARRARGANVDWTAGAALPPVLVAGVRPRLRVSRLGEGR